MAKKKAVKKTVVGEGTRGRKPALAGKRLHFTKKEHTLRGSGKVRASFDLIKDGMSFEEFIEKGGALKDINYFVKRGWVKTSTAGGAAKKSKAAPAAEQAAAA